MCNVLGIQNVTDATRQIKDSRKVRLNLGLPGRAPLRRWSTSTPFPKLWNPQLWWKPSVVTTAAPGATQRWPMMKSF
ncbi:hypothetical protein [Pseudomonas otitidis]|uniref:hypothetical protein n=1 Tax=Metapseudomonas otitidis TaxID=319939 RepID=UPI000944A567